MHEYADYILVILEIVVVILLVILVVVIIVGYCCQYKCAKEEHTELDFIIQRERVARTATARASYFFLRSLDIVEITGK